MVTGKTYSSPLWIMSQSKSRNPCWQTTMKTALSTNICHACIHWGQCSSTIQCRWRLWGCLLSHHQACHHPERPQGLHLKQHWGEHSSLVEGDAMGWNSINEWPFETDYDTVTLTGGCMGPDGFLVLTSSLNTLTHWGLSYMSEVARWESISGTKLCDHQVRWVHTSGRIVAIHG